MSELGKGKKKKLMERRRKSGETRSVADYKPDKSHELGRDGLSVLGGLKNSQFEAKGEAGITISKKIGNLKRGREKRRKDHSSLNDGNHSSLEIERFPKMVQTKSKKPSKKKRKDRNLHATAGSPEKNENVDDNDVYNISSVDEDASKGMKKWLTEYHQSRPGLKVLQERIDDFLSAHDAQLEQERKEREDKAAADGWTVVVRNKGRNKTTDIESGTSVGFVARASVEHNMAKKKNKEVGGRDFYRFQRREAQRNEIMMLQSKFEEDKKRIQQLRATRKFRPY